MRGFAASRPSRQPRSALEATSIQTFEISETCVWHLSRRWRALLEALENWSKMNNRIHITIMKLAPGRERWLHTHTGQLYNDELIIPCMESVWQFATLRFSRNRFEALSLSQYFTLNVWFFVPAQHVNSSPAMGDSTREPRLDPWLE